MRTWWIFFGLLVVLNIIIGIGYRHKRQYSKTTFTTLLDEPLLTRYQAISAQTPSRVRDFFDNEPQVAHTWITASDKLQRSINRLTVADYPETNWKDFFFHTPTLPMELADSLWLGWTSYRDATQDIIEKNLVHHQHWYKFQERVTQTRARLLAGHTDTATRKSWDSITAVFFWSRNVKPEDNPRVNQLITVINKQSSVAPARHIKQLLTSGDAILVGQGKIGQHNQVKSMESLSSPELRSLHRQLTILKGRVDQQLSADLNVIVQ